MAEGVKALKDITITYEATGYIGVFNIFTDMPGGALESRKQLTLALTTTRKTETFPLDTAGEIAAKLIQYKALPASTAGVLKLYSGKIRFREYGLYLDGAAGDIWQSQPMTLGAG